MDHLFHHHLAQLSAPNALGLLQGKRLGVEKECLRVTNLGALAQTPHPKSLGSALAHPYITTDYSEALLELITPPLDTSEQVIDWLVHLHTYTVQHLNHERLWPCSMPCALPPEKDIPIAQYGHSNLGQMKTIYRQGLAHRYGKSMQMIAGIHFNFSFSDDFWKSYQTILKDTQNLRDFKDQQYFAMMRNFRRYAWFIILLFGASPALCQSFILRPFPDELKTFGTHTLYAPEGTSLRMSNLGYQNKQQAQLNISYNHLQAYVTDLQKAVATIAPDFSQYGSVLEGKKEQLTPNILQIEAEYYSPIRAKCTPQSHERPTHALSQRGVEYIEVRVVDLNPYEPVGINADQLRLLESFLVMCLLQPSPDFTSQETHEIKENLKRAAYHGQNDMTRLIFQGHSITIKEKTKELWAALTDCAHLLDQHHHYTRYQSAVQALQKSPLLSTRILEELQTHYEGNFFNFSQHYAKQHEQFFQQHSLSQAVIEQLDTLARKSHERQQQYERENALSLEDYVREYLQII